MIRKSKKERILKSMVAQNEKLFERKTLKDLTMCKEMRSASFKNVTDKLFFYKSYRFKIYIKKIDLGLNNLQQLIRHKIQPYIHRRKH